MSIHCLLHQTNNNTEAHSQQPTLFQYIFYLGDKFMLWFLTKVAPIVPIIDVSQK